MFCQGCQGSVCEPDPGADQSTMELVGYLMSQKEMRDIYHRCIPFKKVPGVPLLWRTAKAKDHSGYTLLPDGSAA